MPLANGDVFAGYRILRTLGVGGMGEVYLVAHPRLPRQDALKILPAEMSSDADFRARFNREAELVASLYNPHIVGIHDRGEFRGQLWISMDFIDGPDAGRLLRDQYPNGMPPQDVVEIVAAVGDALDYAHARGLLHRDVKPPNILLTNLERGRRRIVLADFGIARNASETHGLTETNMTVGTVNYASPEQLMGGAIDGRADQYGLAATAYHLLTGSPMFGTSNPAVVIGRHLNSPPPRLGEFHPALARLDPVLAKAVSKNPNDRFRTCTDFANALRLAIEALPPPPPRPVAVPGAFSQPRSPMPPAPPPPLESRTAMLPAEYAAPAIDDYAARVGDDYAARVGDDYAARVGDDYAGRVMDEPVSPEPARWPWALAGVTLVMILGALIFLIWPKQDSSTPATSTSRTAPTSALPTSATTSTSTSTSAASPAVTFESMKNVVNGFYGELPLNAREAWSKLDTHYQQRNGMDDYLGFWSTIQSVSVLSVAPRDATSVVATLRYVIRDGRIDTENRWLSVVPNNGQLLIYDSERIGPA